MPHGACSSGVRRTGRLGWVAAALAATAAVAAPAAAAAELRSASGARDTGGPRVFTGTSGSKLFFDHRRRMTFSFRVEHRRPVTARIRLIKVSDGTVVDRWTKTVDDDSQQRVSWEGVVGRKLQEERRYAFRLTARDSRGATAESARTRDTDRDSFKLYHHRFPVRGRHQYWDGFGAGRGHQGTDVGAACGTRLQAARGGKVQYSGYQSAAGHYVVIDAKNTRRDYVYMHLRRRGAAEGERINTGESIGTVGDSGNASGCHLHFEMWSAPGWYEGGNAIDSEPHLRRWDRYS